MRDRRAEPRRIVRRLSCRGAPRRLRKRRARAARWCAGRRSIGQGSMHACVVRAQFAGPGDYDDDHQDGPRRSKLAPSAAVPLGAAERSCSSSVVRCSSVWGPTTRRRLGHLCVSSRYLARPASPVIEPIWLIERHPTAWGTRAFRAVRDLNSMRVLVATGFGRREKTRLRTRSHEISREILCVFP